MNEASGWALGFPPGEGMSHVARVEAYGDSGVVAEGVVTVEFADALTVVGEGDDGELRIVLSEASDEAISVRVFVRGDEAREFRDVVPLNELVVFPPGVTEATVAVRALVDGRHEGDERAVALLDGPRGGALGFQRRAVILIADADPDDADLVAEFGDGAEPFEAGAGTTARAVELLSSAADARPGQARFEGALSFAWEASGEVGADFPLARDASHADGLEFWFLGDGSGRDVRVELRDGRDDTRPWTLAWSDEFDGPAGTLPDPSVWQPEIGDGTANGIPGWGNAERQAYTDDPANVALDGEGNLVIRALETGGDGPPCYYGAPCEYTSARIVTAGTVEVTYGRIEARLKIPTGPGLWPAFWMLGNDLAEVGWPEAGEIDIMENVGREPGACTARSTGPATRAATRSAAAPCCRTAGRSPRASTSTPSTGRPRASPGPWMASRYSTVTPDDLPGDARWVFDHPFFLVLNVAVGGNWPGYPDATTRFPQEMVIDYVRVYQAPDTSARFAASFSDTAEGWALVAAAVRGVRAVRRSARGRAGGRPLGPRAVGHRHRGRWRPGLGHDRRGAVDPGGLTRVDCGYRRSPARRAGSSPWGPDGRTDDTHLEVLTYPYGDVPTPRRDPAPPAGSPRPADRARRRRRRGACGLPSPPSRASRARCRVPEARLAQVVGVSATTLGRRKRAGRSPRTKATASGASPPCSIAPPGVRRRGGRRGLVRRPNVPLGTTAARVRRHGAGRPRGRRPLGRIEYGATPERGRGPRRHQSAFRAWRARAPRVRRRGGGVLGEARAASAALELVGERSSTRASTFRSRARDPRPRRP